MKKAYDENGKKKVKLLYLNNDRNVLSIITYEIKMWKYFSWSSNKYKSYEIESSSILLARDGLKFDDVTVIFKEEDKRPKFLIKLFKKHYIDISE